MCSVSAISRVSGVRAIYLRESSHPGGVFYGMSDIDLFIVTADSQGLDGRNTYSRTDKIRRKLEYVFPFLGIDIVEKHLFTVMYVGRGGIYSERRSLRLLYGEDLIDEEEYRRALAKLPKLKGIVYFLINTLRRIPLRNADVHVLAISQERCYAKISRNLSYFIHDGVQQVGADRTDRKGFEEYDERRRLFEPFFLAFDKLDGIISEQHDDGPRDGIIDANLGLTSSGGIRYDLSDEPGEEPILIEITDFLRSIPRRFTDAFSSIILSSTPCAYRSYRVYFILREGSSSYDSIYSDKDLFEEFYRICGKIKRRVSLHAHNPYFLTEGMLQCFLEYIDHNTLPWEEYYLRRNAEVLYGSNDLTFFDLPGHTELRQRIGVFILLVEKVVKKILYEGSSCFQNRIILWMNYIFGMMPACKLLLFNKMVVTTPGEAQAEYLRSDFSDRMLFEKVWRKYASGGILLDEIKRKKALQEAIILDTSELLLMMIDEIKRELKMPTT